MFHVYKLSQAPEMEMSDQLFLLWQGLWIHIVTKVHLGSQFLSRLLVHNFYDFYYIEFSVSSYDGKLSKRLMSYETYKDSHL